MRGASWFPRPTPRAAPRSAAACATAPRGSASPSSPTPRCGGGRRETGADPGAYDEQGPVFIHAEAAARGRGGGGGVPVRRGRGGCCGGTTREGRIVGGPTGGGPAGRRVPSRRRSVIPGWRWCMCGRWSTGASCTRCGGRRRGLPSSCSPRPVASPDGWELRPIRTSPFGRRGSSPRHARRLSRPARSARASSIAGRAGAQPVRRRGTADARGRGQSPRMGRVGAAGARKPSVTCRSAPPPPAPRSAPRSARRPCAGCRWRRRSARPFSDGLVDADAAHERRVLAGRLERGRDVGEDDTGRPRQQLRRALHRQRTREARVDLERVPREDRDADTRAGHLQLRDLQDLAGLVAELLLLVRLERDRRPRRCPPAAAR